MAKSPVTTQADFPSPALPATRNPIPGQQRQRIDGGYTIPTFDYGMAFSDLGNSGLRQYAGWVREEFLPQLQGREAARVYREMLDNSAVVGATMFAINATMRKIDWRVEPADDSPEAAMQAEFFEGCMSDMSHTWGDFIMESLSMLGYGFAPHEIVYKRSMGPRPGIGADGKPLAGSKFDDGLIRWRRIPLRGQETILKWFFTQQGEIVGMTQQPWTGPLVDLPIEKLLLFRSTIHKGNPEGRSILRGAYRSYYFSKRFEEMEAIMFERMGGIPVISVPKQLLDDAASGNAEAIARVATYKKIATNVRIDEQMGLIIPSDLWESVGSGASSPQYKFELVTPQGGRGQSVDSDKAIVRYNTNILASMLADFIQLGHESRGTQSLAVSKTDMFFQAMEAFLNSNGEVLSRHAVPRLADLNGFDPTRNPTFKPDMPQRLDLDTLSNFLLRLSQAGMPLFPNDTLQQFVLDAAGMPDVTEDADYSLLSDAKMQSIEAANDALRNGAEGNTNPDNENEPPQGRTNLEKAILGAVGKRLLKMGGGNVTGVRKRKSNRRNRLS